VADAPLPITRTLKKEALLFLVLLFFGLVILPIAIWFVGSAVFGEYGGAGYGDFFGTLSAKIRSGDVVAWFLVLSPWITWQIVRLAVFGWRKAARL
jgi:hypothetical protein